VTLIYEDALAFKQFNLAESSSAIGVDVVASGGICNQAQRIPIKGLVVAEHQ
jgi:hypothetical protein